MVAFGRRGRWFPEEGVGEWDFKVKLKLKISCSQALRTLARCRRITETQRKLCPGTH